MTDLTIADRLERLLAAERDALLKGDFDTIAALLDEKEQLVDRLRTTEMAAATLEPLRNGMRRNHQLFDQALAGIRNVAARLGDLSRAGKTVHTYDSTGKKQVIEAKAPPKLERRA